ncbi:MAG TPA: hypothetical protein VF599_06405 [Pyrinomonadaceae bacterium]|jgi:hypothetical protein
MNQEKTELSKSEEWFRDRLNDYLQYGLGAFVVLAGWLLSSDSIISLSTEADADKKEAAVMLAILLPILWAIWYLVLLKIHTRCPPHETVIRRLYLHLYAEGVALALFILWLLVADVFSLFANR